ncbi:2Fe-2S iron-sulfur cluster-binding protein [Marinobacterium jannaschii]|uniref:2Fe-2S iron-sulfur cluster-binding protein n=1 Tax=Marinobacterium jannaschii TaxID=64970 RepID=UPI0004808FF2|nr:2Fe-2S iron-sulfur cluster-binding protein [Marinobacterium jannaschii]
MSIEITIDGQAVACEAGTPLIDVAADNGVYIPSLCYVRGKRCLGTCRICSVRVDGNVMAACSVPACEGMQVEVSAPQIADLRKALVEILFVEGNHNCPSCEKSGRCDLQAVGYEIGMMVSRFPYRFSKHPREVRAKNIWLERDRCIFCQRCVEFVRDREGGQKIFSISQRGDRAQIELDIGLADAMPPDQVREAVELCPVGCILEKGVGYDNPIGQRRYETRTLRQRTLEVKQK